MSGEELWTWWFSRTGAQPRSLGLYDRAFASRVVREAGLSSAEDADDYFDWLSSWYSGVDMAAMLRYADRWIALRSTQTRASRIIKKYGGQW